MTSVHVITKHNRHLYEDAMLQSHRLRHRIFVEERQWSNLRCENGLEVDSYDTADTVYLLAIDNDRVVGGQRLYPTVRPHMISEVFAHLATRGIPRSPRILEWTRYFVIKERRMGRTDSRLLAALQDYCIGAGIAEVTAVVEMWWLPRWHQAGFKVRPLGLPVVVDGQPCIAAAITICETSLMYIRDLAGLRGPTLVRHGPAHDATVPHAAA